nr:ASCH domain-containing protein [Nitrosomonas nitrosa]
MSQTCEMLLLSVQPRYSVLICSGSKRVEFRRQWASRKVDTIAIYATSPTQRIVALADVEDVVSASPAKLWSHCQDRNGGLSRTGLMKYFTGKSIGFAVLLGKVHQLANPVNPWDIDRAFSPPQSFQYLTQKQASALRRKVMDVAVG